MPRNFLFTKEEIIEAAISLTKEKGINAITARSLGNKLGTSSRPIFSYFNSMSEVQNSVIEEANKIFSNYITKEIEQKEYPPYKASGMAYITFARNEKELFKLLFMRDRTNEDKTKTSKDMDMLVDIICKQVNISKENAILFYVEMWAYVHGIATMIATNYYDWDKEFTSKSLTDMYQGLKYKYES